MACLRSYKWFKLAFQLGLQKHLTPLIAPSCGAFWVDFRGQEGRLEDSAEIDNAGEMILLEKARR